MAGCHVPVYNLTVISLLHVYILINISQGNFLHVFAGAQTF